MTSLEIARELYETGRAHALAADRLFHAALDDGQLMSPDDPELFAFNGTYSLSTHYLIGLGLELMLKGAYVAHGGSPSDDDLRKIGHDLVLALDMAEERGFRSKAANLRELVQLMVEPYKQHWFRYKRPSEIPLPAYEGVHAVLVTLDGELEAILGIPPAEPAS